MSRNYANIVTAIWADPEWRALDERSQRLYLLLATQKNISAAGMLPLTIGRWAGMAKDSTPETIRAGLRRLAADRFVALDETHEELLVRSFVRHDNGYNNKKRRMVIEAAAGEIESRVLRQVLAVELVRLGLPAGWTREEPVELPEGALPFAVRGGPEGVDGASSHSNDLPVDNPVDNAFPQVDRPYQNSGRPIPEEGTSDRVVVTEEVVVRTSTHNPQPLPPPAAPAVPADADDGLFAAPAKPATPVDPAREAQNRAFGIARWWATTRRDADTPVVAGGKNGPIQPLRSLIEQFTPYYSDDEIRDGLTRLDIGFPSKPALERSVIAVRRQQQDRQPALPARYEPRGTVAHSDRQVPREPAEARKARGWLDMDLSEEGALR